MLFAQTINYAQKMGIWDWSIFAALILVLIGLLIYCQRYSRSISDFLSASRCSGRYLLCVAQGASSWDVIGAIATFQMFYEAGFTSQWWSFLTGPLGLILGIFGWVTYRLRETRCFTVSQFFEVRYSRKFRICSGIITWLSGVVNFGVFPAVSIRFMMFFCGMPAQVRFLCVNWDVYALLLIAYVATATVFAIFGGQIAIMLTDFVQATICNLSFIVFIFFIFKLGSWDATGGYVSWDQISEALRMANPGESQVNPFDCAKFKSFNMWYFLIGLFSSIYGRGTWQGNMGYASAALTPHEGRMANMLGTWRGMAQSLLLMLFPLAVIVFMRLPEFEGLRSAIATRVNGIADPQLKSQALVPIAMSLILPTGLLGLFLAVMFAGMLSTDDSYMHSWGSIFIQDVIMPFRKKPFSPKMHLLALRLSIIGVGIFSVLFSYYFHQTEEIFMFFAITGAIISGAGAVMIGGLYWKHGTTLAAWVTYLFGAVAAISNIVLSQVWNRGFSAWLFRITHWGWVGRHLDKFPVNGTVMSFYIMATCLVLYFGISLIQKFLGKTQPFNLDKMLHRGQYDTHEEHVVRSKARPWERVFGVTKEFSFGDRLIYAASLLWTVVWFAVFIIWSSVYFFDGSITDEKFIGGISTGGWLTLWKWRLYVILLLGITCTFWLAIGGIIDVVKLFKRLKTMQRNDSDDGSVRDGNNAE